MAALGTKFMVTGHLQRVCMAPYMGRVYGARVIVTSLYGSLKDRIYSARVIVTSLYGSLQGQSLWCKDNCNEFVWQFTGTVYSSWVIVTILYGS